jgi:hypothetical protein
VCVDVNVNNNSTVPTLYTVVSPDGQLSQPLKISGLARISVCTRNSAAVLMRKRSATVHKAIKKFAMAHRNLILHRPGSFLIKEQGRTLKLAL